MRHAFVVLAPILCSAFLLQPIPANASDLAIGDCRPRLPSYRTISEAITAAPSGATIYVCPGTYPEQVTITNSLTLSGVIPGAAVIVVPGAGLGTANTQLVIQGDPHFLPSPANPSPVTVNITNLVVDGSGSTDHPLGISYAAASGQLSGVEMRNQWIGIEVGAGESLNNTVEIKDSNIHDFGAEGATVALTGAFGALLNISDTVVKSSAGGTTGINYYWGGGTASHNVINLDGGIGLNLEPLSSVTALANVIEGGDVGISSLPPAIGGTLIKNNIVVGSHTGIFVSGSYAESGYGTSVLGNVIAQSAAQAIVLQCGGISTVENNLIMGAPIGIENTNSSDTVASNRFYSVETETTWCSAQ